MRLCRIVAIAAAASFLPVAIGVSQDASDADGQAARKERLELIRKRLDEFELLRGSDLDTPLVAADSPVLRWSNPIRSAFSDGAMFLWLHDKRPVAATTVSLRGDDSIWIESVSLVAEPLRCIHQGREFWTPASGAAAARLPDAPAPAATARSRLVQMRRLAEQFALRMTPMGEQPTQLRLLTQPIYRFEAGPILDGAIFAFTETTDPEALLLLEAVRPEDTQPAQWQYRLARMTSRPMVGRYDDKQVWSVDSYWSNPRTPSDPYIERRLEAVAIPGR